MIAPKIRNISFDAAGTLLHPFPSVGAVYGEILEQHGLRMPAKTLQTGFQNAFTTIAKNVNISDGEEREWDYWRRIVAEIVKKQGIRPTDFDKLFEDLWIAFSKGERWQIEEGATEVLTSLRQQGYKISLLTNWDKRVRTVLDELGLTPLFDALFISSEIGCDKPEPEIFQRVAKRLDAAPSEILHVGDSLVHDFEGARRAGWNALLLRGQHADSIQSLRELAQKSRPDRIAE